MSITTDCREEAVLPPPAWGDGRGLFAVGAGKVGKQMLGLRTVRGRIILAFSVLIVLLIGIALISAFRLRTSELNSDTLKRASLTSAALADIEAELSLQVEAIGDFAASGDAAFAEAFRDSVARVEEHIGEAQALQGEGGRPQSLASLEQMAGQVGRIEMEAEGFFLLTTLGNPANVQPARSQVEGSIAGLRSVVEQLLSEQQQQMESELAQADGEADLLLWFLVASAGLVLIVGALSAAAVIRSVLRPLASLRASVRSIASGDVTTRPVISGAAEFEALARDLERMTVALLARETVEMGAAQAEARYRQLAERAADLIFRVDIEKGLTYANPAWEKVTGYTPEELAAGPQIAGRLIHPDHWHSFVALWKGMLSGVFPQGPQPMKWLRKDGQVIWLVLTFLPVYDAHGRLIAVEGMGRDATLLRHLLKEVRDRDDQLRRLLSLSKSVASSIQFDEAADAALKGTLELLSPAEGGLLLAYNRRTGLLEVRAVRGLDCKAIAKLTVKPGEGLIGQIFQRGGAGLYSSMKEAAAAGLGPEHQEWFKRAGGKGGLPQSMICAPVGVGERLLGCLLLVTFSRSASFQPSHLDLLQAAADQMAAPLENARLREETELTAISDSLTGLYNQAYLHERLAEEIERAKRYQHGFAVVFIEIDSFKAYNDARGQAAGDKVLCLAADSIRSQMRRSDVACRYGDDQFAAIFMHADAGRAQTILERIGKTLASKLKAVDGADLGLNAGIACYPNDGSSVDELVKVADASLYSVKLGGSGAARTA